VSALVLAFVPLGTVGRAHADPIDDKQAEAKALQDQIDANGRKIGALSEQYNGAQYRLEQAQAAVAEAQQKIADTQAEVARLQGLLNERAAAHYRSIGQAPFPLDASSGSELIKQTKYSAIAAERDAKLLKDLHRAEAALRDDQAKAEQAEADAQDEQKQIEKTRAGIEAATAQQENLLGQVNGEIAQLVAEEQARREAAALAEAQARFTAAAEANAAAAAAQAAADAANRPAAPAPNTRAAPSPASSKAPAPAAKPPSANVPVNGGGAATAIAYARAQLGKPYRYAAAGPDAFDCSGLTMRAWGAAGVSMPHYSGAQYSMFPKVPLGSMLPGDLVFWGPGGSEHVGLYIGGGQMIAAPSTGDVVKIQAVWGSPVGAVRPG
jgi:cell wall-associated NlpC family hydrolase